MRMHDAVHICPRPVDACMHGDNFSRGCFKRPPDDLAIKGDDRHLLRRQLAVESGRREQHVFRSRQAHAHIAMPAVRHDPCLEKPLGCPHELFFQGLRSIVGHLAVPFCALYSAVQPQSIVCALPVMPLAASEQRKVANCATSRGSSRRWMAPLDTMIFSTTSSSGMPYAFAWSAICFSTSGVRTYDGQIALQVTPRSPAS